MVAEAYALLLIKCDSCEHLLLDNVHTQTITTLDVGSLKGHGLRFQRTG